MQLANYGSAFITVMFLVGCIVGLFLVDRIGRRPLIIHSFLWGGVALLLLGIFPDASAWIVSALFAGYAVVIGGTQILQWIYLNELSPTEISGSAAPTGVIAEPDRAAICTNPWFPFPCRTSVPAAPLSSAPSSPSPARSCRWTWAPGTRGLTLGERADEPQLQGECLVTSAPDPLCQKGMLR